jgi:hypothetical protein
MSISIALFLISASFVVFAIYSLYKFDRRKTERRQRKTRLPFQRRKVSRRKTGLTAHFEWAIRHHVARVVRPKPPEPAKPKRKPGPRVEYH